MCRWLAYSGSPLLLDELLYKPKHSLIDQSLHSTMGAETGHEKLICESFGSHLRSTGSGAFAYSSMARSRAPGTGTPSFPTKTSP